jgi:ankyrin repeat protein
MTSKVLAILVLAPGILAGCAENKSGFGGEPPRADRVAELEPSKRAALLPNDLFTAVYDNSVEAVRAGLSADLSRLESVNEQGDTPLGLALALGHREVAKLLLDSTPAGGLFHLNKAGESYVYLAARSGFTEAIDRIAGIYYQSLGGLQRYHFADLDQPTVDGRNALFVAADRRVAESLATQYYRGLMKFPFWSFTLHADSGGGTFLHTAAADGRADLILWAAEKTCSPGALETSERVWLSWPSALLTYVLRGAETYTYVGDLDLPTAVLFNRQDQNGQTALHAALSRHQWAAARALASCRWLDYDLADAQGDLPLQSFLKSLNPYRAAYEADAREIFTFLLEQNTRLRRWTMDAPARVNWADQDGDTALHLAARLADPYFYRRLAAIGDIHALNRAGVTAESIYLNRQKQVGAHGL